MLSVRLSAKMEKKLGALSRKTGRTKSFFVRWALAQNFEDLEDIYLADQSRAEIAAAWDGKLTTLPKPFEPWTLSTNTSPER